MLLFNGGYFSLITWTPVLLVRVLGATQSEAGFVTSLITAGSIIAWPLVGLLTDRFGGRKVVVILSQAATGLLCLAYAFVVPQLALWGAALVAFGAGLFTAGMILTTVMAVELFPPELAGTVTSVVNTFFFIGAFTVPVLLGRVLDLTQSFPHAFVTAAAVQLLAVLTASFIKEPARGR